MRVCELRQKEVINICSCRALGCPLDVEFDCKTGCIQALIVPLPGKMCGFFGPTSEYVIPYSCIRQIRRGYYPGGDQGRKVPEKGIRTTC